MPTPCPRGISIIKKHGAPPQFPYLVVGDRAWGGLPVRRGILKARLQNFESRVSGHAELPRDLFHACVYERGVCACVCMCVCIVCQYMCVYTLLACVASNFPILSPCSAPTKGATSSSRGFCMWMWIIGVSGCVVNAGKGTDAGEL